MHHVSERTAKKEPKTIGMMSQPKVPGQLSQSGEGRGETLVPKDCR